MNARGCLAIALVFSLLAGPPLRVFAHVANSNQPILPPGAKPLPDPIVRAGNEALSAWLKQLDAGFTGPRVDDEGRPLGGALVEGLELAHVINIAMLSQGAERLDGIRSLPADQKLKLLDDLRPFIQQADDAYVNLVGAEATARDLGGREKSIFDAKMAEAARLDATDPAKAAALRLEAARSPWGIYLSRRQEFFSLLQQQPLLGLIYDTWLPGDERYLFKKLYTLPPAGTTAEYNQSRLDVFDVALENTADMMRDMAADAREITDFSELLQYTLPRYAPVWAQAEAMSRGPGGLSRMGELVAPLASMGEAWRYDSLFWTTTVDVLLNVASTLVVIVPVWGALIGAGVQFVQIIREGNQYRVALVDLAQAEASASAFGQARVIEAQDRLAAERGEFVLAGVSGAFDITQSILTPARAAGANAPTAGGAAPPPATGMNAPPVPVAGRTPAPGAAPDPNATLAPPVSRPPAAGVDPSATLPPPDRAPAPGTTPDPNATLAPPGRSTTGAAAGTAVDRNAVTVVESPAGTGIERGAAAGSPSAAGVDRVGATMIDVPTLDRDAALLGTRIDGLRQQLADVNDALDPVLAGARPDLVTRRSQIVTELAAVDAELVELRPLVPLADKQPLPKAGAVDRNAATLIDPRQLGEDIRKLNARRSALINEQLEVNRQLTALADKLRPDLSARKTALERDLKALVAERNDVTDNIARAIGLGDYESGIAVYSDMARQRRALVDEMDGVRAEIAKTTDPVQIRVLERRLAALQARFNDLSERYFQVGKYLDDQQDQIELDEALEYLEEQKALARAGGIPESRIAELTQGVENLTMADAVAAVADQLSAARIAAQPGVQIVSTAASGDLFKEAFEDFTFVRSAILEARANGGRLSDAAVGFIERRRSANPDWFDRLPLRVIEGHSSGQFFRVADEDLAAELRGLFDRRATPGPSASGAVPSGAAGQTTSQPGTPAAAAAPDEQVAEALRLSQTMFQVTMTTGQVVKAAGELPRPPTAAPSGAPAPSAGLNPSAAPAASTSPVTSTSAPSPDPVITSPTALTPMRAAQLAVLGAEIAALNAVAQQASAAASNPELSEEERAVARRDYYAALDDSLRNQITVDQIRLNQLWENANNLENGLTDDERAEVLQEHRELLDEQRDRHRQWRLVRVMRDLEILEVQRHARRSAAAAPGGVLPGDAPGAAPIGSAKAVNVPSFGPSPGGMITVRPPQRPSPASSSNATYAAPTTPRPPDSGVPPDPYSNATYGAPTPPRPPDADSVPDSSSNATIGAPIAEPPPVFDPVVDGIPFPFPLITITPDMNPAFVRSAGLSRRVQNIGGTSDGEEIVVPAAASSGGRPFAGAWLPWLPRPAAAMLSVLGLRAPRAAPMRALQARSAPRAQSDVPPVTVLLTSLGRSAGDAFEMTILNRGATPVHLSAGAIVLEPLDNISRDAVAGAAASAPTAGRAKATLKGYCLDFDKLPPAAGMVFRLAPESLQRRYPHLERIFAASRALRAAGQLAPPSGDPSDAAEYFDAIRQWAIWTRQQSWDERGYTRAFVDHSRRNVTSAGRRWTSEIERAITALAPARWKAIQQVLRSAESAGVR